MINQDQKNQFVELRAKGNSFDNICKELKISKPTLIKLDKELKTEVSNFAFIETQNLLEKYKLNKFSELETYCQELGKINTELSKRSYEEISTTQLFKLKSDIEAQIQTKIEKNQYFTGEQINTMQNFDFCEPETLSMNL